MVDDDEAHEQRLLRLLQHAATQAALPSWPTESPPHGSPDLPVVDARRDDDGSLVVFRFFRVVDADPEPLLELTVAEALARVEGLQEVAVGDEVGVELPLPRVCAIALATLAAARGGRPHLLPLSMREWLGADAVVDRLIDDLDAALGVKPQSSALTSLRSIAIEHGGGCVEWTAIVEVPGPRSGDDAEAPVGEGSATAMAELILLLSRDGHSRIVGIPADGDPRRRSELVRVLLPAPLEDGLWHLLVGEAPALLAPDQGSLAVTTGESAVRFVVNRLEISSDPSRFAEVTVAVSLQVDSPDGPRAAEALVALSVDPVSLLGTRIDESARRRVVDAAAVFARRTQARLADQVRQGGELDPARILAGSAVLRVLVRAARGVAWAARDGIGLDLAATEEGALEVQLMPEGGASTRWAIRFQPADDSAFVLLPDDSWACIYADGELVDGDVEAWRAACAVISEALAGTDADVELAFDEGGEDVQPFSTWLQVLAEHDVVGWLSAHPAVSGAWQETVDVLLEER